MSETTDNSIGSDSSGPGSSLRRARQARNMTTNEVAQELHLDPWIIEALEEDRFEILGAPVFAKGHLRQYGALLGLPVDDLMIAYYRLRGRDDAPPPPITATMVRASGNRRLIWAGILLALLVVGALVLLLWFMASSSEQAYVAPSTRVNESASEPLPDSDRFSSAGEPADVVNAGETAAAPANTAANADQPASGTPVVQNAAVSETVSEPETPAAATGDVALQLLFNDESWVEVYGAGEDRLLYGMYPPGSRRQVQGLLPIEIYLGRAQAVELSVNGRRYPVPNDSIRGNTARFIIDELP